MVTTVVRDKYVQSETITERAEEAGELMTRMEENDEILSQRADSHLATVKTSGFFFFSSCIRWERMTPTASISLSLVHPSIKLPPHGLSNSPTPFATFL